MEKKNRFSILLERLMGTVNLKNATLAAELQYDVSYISKWINGKTLPSEKSVAQILHVISDYIVESATSAALKTLYIEYQVDVPEDLKQAIYDNLEAEYFYVKGLTKTIGADVAPETQNYAKLTLYQFLKKMSHPALRLVCIPSSRQLKKYKIFVLPGVYGATFLCRQSLLFMKFHWC